MSRLSWNLGTSTSWNSQGQSRPVMGLIYLCFLRLSVVCSIDCWTRVDGISMSAAKTSRNQKTCTTLATSDARRPTRMINTVICYAHNLQSTLPVSLMRCRYVITLSDAQRSCSGITRVNTVKTSPPALIGTASEDINLENEQDCHTTMIGSKNLFCFISVW